MLSRSPFLAWRINSTKALFNKNSGPISLYTKMKFHSLIKSNPNNHLNISKISVNHVNSRAMSNQKKVVFSANPKISTNSGTSRKFNLKPRGKTLQRAQNHNISQTKSRYMREQREVFEAAREKWIHNATKEPTKDRYEDNITINYNKLQNKNRFNWLDSADKYASKSSDPLAALLSKVIDNKKHTEAQTDFTNFESNINSTLKKEVLKFYQDKDR